MKKVLLHITAWEIILFFSMAAANAQTPQDIAKKGLASTVSLVMNNDSYGSGFFVLPDQIATAYHVVEGASSGYVSPVHQSEKYPIVGITAIDRDNDLIILKISGARGIPLPIGNSETVDILHQVIVVGNPLGYEGTVTEGKIINNSLGNRLLTDTKINRGNSGGAVLGTVLPNEGKVIGVAVAKVLDIVPGTGNIADSLNIVVPSKYLTPLVEKAKDNQGTLKPLSVDGVTGTHLTWSPNGLLYLFTLHNQRNDTIWNLHCLVIFKNNKGVICVDQFKPVVPFLHPGRVNQISRLVVADISGGVADINHTFSHVGTQVQQLMKSYEIRILDFDIAPPHITGGLVPLEGVTGNGFTWLDKKDWGANFSYSLQNHLSEGVKDVVSWVVFYDKKGFPIEESLELGYQEIPAMGTVQAEGLIFSDVKLVKSYEIKIYQRKFAK